MTLPALVLVHGGGHAADCWGPTIEEIVRQAPELEVLASTGQVDAASRATS